MDLTRPVVNVTCSCGARLESWAEVEEHFRRHRDTGDHLDAAGRALATALATRRRR